MIIERIRKLRELMEQENIDTYIITKFDPHQSEYSPEHYNEVKFISGFTGSQAKVVITKDTAGLWTDGRYFVQALNQLEGTGIELQKENLHDSITYYAFAAENTPEKGIIAFDGYALSSFQVDSLIKEIDKKDVQLKTNTNLISKIWNDRPPLSSEKAFELDIEYAGKTSLEKLSEIREIMNSKNIEKYIVSDTNDICWLYNIRCNNGGEDTTIPAYTIITDDSTVLYVNQNKISEVFDKISKDGIIIKPYEDIEKDLNKASENIAYVPAKTNFALTNMIEVSKRIILDLDITSELKSQKNQVEIDNMKKANIKDCVALVKFIKWLKENADKVNEYEACEKLLEFRKNNENFLSVSFKSIGAYMENAAMMHYSAPKEGSKKLDKKGFFLIDSGGHYLEGTTDITRTIVLGELSPQMKKDFTLVFKGMANLARQKFLYGSTGHYLDVLARKPIWDSLIDYKCGTGHGIGYLLSVHESPPSFSPKYIEGGVLKEGMITSDEPGIYRDNEYGIRTENTLLVKELTENQFGKFMEFEVISPCPIDLDGIDESLLSPDEIEYLNDFHKDVYEKLSPYLNESEKEFLRSQTKSIAK